MIDPKTLEVGDVVTLTGTVACDFDGTFVGFFKESLTITKVEKPVKPFDWKDVKPGMAFLINNSGLLFYVGPSFSTKESVVMHEQKFGSNTSWRKEYLTRAPEHDMNEVKP